MKHQRSIWTVAVLLLTVLALSVGAAAESSSFSNDLKAFSSSPIGTPEVDIVSLIREKVTKERVDSQYALYSPGTIGLPSVCRFDPAVYVLQYSVSTSFWSNVTEANYTGITEGVKQSYPTVYVPLFGAISDSSGVSHTRVIGHVKLSYDWKDREYDFGLSLYGFSTSNYRDGEMRSFEKLLNYLEKSEHNAEQVFLLRHPNAHSDFMETVAVVKTDSDTVILDLSDSLHLTSSTSVPAVAYSVEEFRTRRLEAEKELYKNAGSWENVQFGGSGSSGQSRSDTVRQWLPYVLIGGLVLCAGVTVLILRKGRANKA